MTWETCNEQKKLFWYHAQKTQNVYVGTVF